MVEAWWLTIIKKWRNYENFSFLIVSSQIIYDHMEIIQYQHLFIYLSFYLFIYWIHNTSPVSLVFSESLSPDKTSTSDPLSRGIFLTLHYQMNFINNRNEEIQAKILEFSANRMQQPLHALILGMWQFYCHSYFALILLCYVVIG